MYPSERKAITQTVSAMINQDSYISDTSIFNKLLTKEAVDVSFKEFMNNTWSSFLSFGSFFSGVFELMLIFKIIKWMFDTIVHSRGLYEVYGCSWHIIASIWDAATTYLLSPVRVAQSNKKTPKESNKGNEEQLLPDQGNQLYPTLTSVIATAPPNSYHDEKPTNVSELPKATPLSYSQLMKERIKKPF